MRNDSSASRIRYAVVGAGHIVQTAVLPGFANAGRAELVALFSSDPVKRVDVTRRYKIEHVHDYDAYDEVLAAGLVDAVYIGLPNHLHCEYAVRAAEHGVHVLCEKPMAVDEDECSRMIQAAREHDVYLMVAYRLHFDPANLEAIDIARRGELGELRLFESTFTADVARGNVRLMSVSKGGGPLYDMGVYCINAARYLFRDEPYEVTAHAAARDDVRFADCPEMFSAMTRFPGERLATFATSFGAAESSRYSLIGDEGRLVLEPAYAYAAPMRLHVETRAGSRTRTFETHDQFGAELRYFADCIIDHRAPEPDGVAGLVDVHLIRALHRSAREDRPLRVLPMRQRRRPDLGQAIALPGIGEPAGVTHVEGPSR